MNILTLLIGAAIGIPIGSLLEFYRQRSRPDYLPSPIPHIQGSEKRMATERPKLRIIDFHQGETLDLHDSK